MKIKKTLIITIPLIILIILSVGTIIYNNNKELVINAKVYAVGSNYLLVRTKNNEDYIIETKNNNYQIGDTLELKLININKNKLPYEAKSKTISLLKTNNIDNNKNIDNDIEYNDTNTNNQENIDNQTNEYIPNNNLQLNNNNNNNEENIILYFKNIDHELDNNTHNLGDKIKEKIVKCINFIFYDEEINGKKFSELTNKTKIKILEIMLSIDYKIEKHFPKYKEDISIKYNNLKSKIVEKYLEITTNICQNDQELCINTKESFQKLKKNFGITWNIIKENTKNGISKLKDWYEIWRNN